MRSSSSTWPHGSTSWSTGDPQTQGWQTQARLTAEWTHQAHSEVPHDEVSHQSASWQGLQLVRLTGGWHSQEHGMDHGDLSESKKAEPVQGVPTNQHATPVGVLL